MKKVLAIIFCFFNAVYAGAQDKKPMHLDIMAGYSVGYQSFRLDKVEYTNREALRYVKQNGYYHDSKFSPTLLNHVEFFVAPFKSKKWYVGLMGDWGRNSITSYGYIGYPDVNVMQLKTVSEFSFWSWGYGVKRSVLTGKMGSILIGFSFNEISGEGDTETTYEVKEMPDGNIIKSGRVFGSGGSNSYMGSIKVIYRVLDCPRFSFDYHVKLLPHLYLKASYSYWLAGGSIANFYGAINRHRYMWDYDLYSHNLSFGLTLRLQK